VVSFSFSYIAEELGNGEIAPIDVVYSAPIPFPNQMEQANSDTNSLSQREVTYR